MPSILAMSFSILLAVIAPHAAGAANLIQQENARSGTHEWRLSHPATHREIEGYASLTSVNRGEPIRLFINTQEPFYAVSVYRMGWYGSAGGRLVHGPVLRVGHVQPLPVTDPKTGLVECDWVDPYLLETGNAVDPAEWLSGVYLVKLTAGVSGKQSYIIFVVREDARRSHLLFQSSVITFQAYNNWGGKSLYGFNSTDDRPARKVSFNRPYAVSSHPLGASGNGAGDFLTTNAIPAAEATSPAGWEYNLVRWLEREGYDVTYSTNIDTHADPRLLLSHKAWLSVGHDEYWSWEMRTQVEGALSHGIGVGFFSANVCYWQIRLEPSPATGQPARVIVAYKDEAMREDPYAFDGAPGNDYLITGRWREPPVNRPEEILVGVMYDTNQVDADIVVLDGQHWVFSGTGLHSGDRLPGLLGYEVDRRFDSISAGVTIVAASPYTFADQLRYSHMATYTHPSGATVFATGSNQWSWGLDDYNAPELRTPRQNPAAQQITRNVLARLIGEFSGETSLAPSEGVETDPVSQR